MGWPWNRKPSETNRLLGLVLNELKAVKGVIMSAASDLSDKLKTVNDTLASIGTSVDKVATETAGLQQTITDLQKTIAEGGLITPALQAQADAALTAVNSLATKVKAVDDLVPDVTS